MTLTPQHLQILQHALGVDEYGKGPHYRNHFCAVGKDEELCRDLVAAGYMETFERKSLPYYNCIVTDAGVAAMLAASPKPPKMTRGQKRYREWLRVGDLYDCGFGDWLKQQKAERP